MGRWAQGLKGRPTLWVPPAAHLRQRLGRLSVPAQLLQRLDAVELSSSVLGYEGAQG